MTCLIFGAVRAALRRLRAGIERDYEIDRAIDRATRGGRPGLRYACARVAEDALRVAREELRDRYVPWSLALAHAEHALRRGFREAGLDEHEADRLAAEVVAAEVVAAIAREGGAS